MVDVFLGLGSNVEAPRHLRSALDELSAAFGETRVSPVYRNPAVGFEGDDFLNLVVACETRLEIDPLKALLHDIERRAGRERRTAHYGPRTLDIDLLLYGDEIRQSPRLPHPDILKRAFVLRPLADLAGQRRHPESGMTYAGHWSAFAGPRDQLVEVKLVEPVGSGESKN